MREAAPTTADHSEQRTAWAEPNRRFGAALDGALWRIAELGQRWEKAGDVPGRAAALSDAHGRLFIAAGGAAFDSAEEGEARTELYRGEEQ